MGARLVKFEFCPKENEQIEAIVKVPEEKRSVIHGVVTDCKNVPVKDAVVKLFEKVKTSCGTKLKPITHTFTDNCGEFLFGPLQPNREYALKVWYHDIKVRKIKFDADKCDDQSGYDDCHGYDYCKEHPDNDYDNCDDNFINDNCTNHNCHEDNHCNKYENQHHYDGCDNYEYNKNSDACDDEDEDICDQHHANNGDCEEEDHDYHHYDDDDDDCEHHHHYHHDDDDDDDCDCRLNKHDGSHHNDDDD